MALQVIATTFGPGLTLQIAQVIQTHCSHNLHHYYEIIIVNNLKSNYTIFIFYNTLERLRYHLGMVVSDGS